MAMNRMFAVLGGPRVGGALSRLAPWAVACVLVAAWGLDLLRVHGNFSVPGWMGPPHSAMDYAPVVSGGVVCALALLALRPASGAAPTTVAGAAAAAAVLAASAVLWPLPMGVFGYAFASSEVSGLLVLLMLAGLRCRPWQIGVVALCSFVAALSDHLREPTPYYESLVTTSLLLVTAGLAPGLYLRWREAQRRSHVEQARSQERLAIARDLHDVVAHEVTGIVVQAQALRHIADRDPGAVRTALPEIEAAGARALESMRGMVSRLREPGDVPLAPDTAAGLARLATPAADGRPEVAVRCGGPVDSLPPTAGTAVLRIAQESVTNALRHARGATLVEVSVEAGPEEVAVRVGDDGQGAAGATGGGFGLVGMAERVRLLGGAFSAGPRDRGWEVAARLPLDRVGDGPGQRSTVREQG
ncbi:sensor histidine kinase [Nocardiopsis deserti]|uniref:sensor histidine kinase n=1 Tax=Nocardiopsis deserti TaxID=2605988 RepID=UPI00123C1656|nr:histidine kinase [Nocardiopsis deserti]